jgi:hypothetical protein
MGQEAAVVIAIHREMVNAHRLAHRRLLRARANDRQRLTLKFADIASR